jgi:NAD(P)-dependent dehydrogenase (short-subunit alcohol dehydrogenase family)
VNAVCPISIDSERLDYLGQRQDGRYDERVRVESIQRRAAAVPVGRLATPRDVAAAVAFLASDEAEFITGESINVAGGALLC